MIYTHLIAGIVGAVIAATSAWQVQNWRYGNTIAQMKQEQAEASQKAQAKAQEAERTLQASITKIRQEKQREATRLAADYATVIDSLHNRPEARAGNGGVPEGSAAGTGCTGAGLARLDASFLAGYSRDAGQLRLAYEECRAAYSEIERQMNGNGQHSAQ